jgi:hypothetical protein
VYFWREPLPFPRNGRLSPKTTTLVGSLLEPLLKKVTPVVG